FFFQGEDGIRDRNVTGVQTCALPISMDQFLPSVTQFIVTGIIIIALIIASFIIGKHNMTRNEKPAPKPLFVGTVTLLLLSMHTIIELLAVLLEVSSDFMMEWPGVIFRLVSLSLLGYLILVWSKQKGWNALHHLALAGEIGRAHV